MIEPFTARIPQAEVDDLHHRLAMTRWAPEQPPGTDDGAYGVPLSRLRRLLCPAVTTDATATTKEI